MYFIILSSITLFGYGFIFDIQGNEKEIIIIFIFICISFLIHLYKKI